VTGYLGSEGDLRTTRQAPDESGDEHAGYRHRAASSPTRRAGGPRRFPRDPGLLRLPPVAVGELPGQVGGALVGPGRKERRAHRGHVLLQDRDAAGVGARGSRSRAPQRLCRASPRSRPCGDRAWSQTAAARSAGVHPAPEA
jgi:hypothetical protein